MAIVSYPFDDAATYEADWRKFTLWMNQHNVGYGGGVYGGVGNQLETYGDSTGMQVKVKTGALWSQGHYAAVETSEEIVGPLTAADVTNDRWDIIAMEIDYANNEADLVIVEGTPAASPALPALTQSSTVWQIPLAVVEVGAGVSTIAAADVIDNRIFLGEQAWNFPVGNGQSELFTGNQYVFKTPKGGRYLLKGWHVNAAKETGSVVFDLFRQSLYWTDGGASMPGTGTKPYLSSQWQRGDVTPDWQYLDFIDYYSYCLKVDSVTDITAATLSLFVYPVYTAEDESFMLTP